MTTGISMARQGHVAWVVLDDPERDNRLSEEVLSQLYAYTQELAQDASVRVVVIHGSGETFFSHGILTPQIKQSLGKHKTLELVALANRSFDAVEALPQIVIAGINGTIRAGACELALVSDIRLMAAHANWQFPEAQWGGFPGAGAPVRLPAMVGMAHTLEMVALSKIYTATELHHMGLVSQVVEGKQLLPALNELAEKYAQVGPLASLGAKAIARTRMTQGFGAARLLSDHLRRSFEFTRDADEGMQAHLSGRKPDFKGQ
jgi:enoyl-CoA hydratase/carnithine racemase